MHKFTKTIKRDEGFTLVELIVYFGIFSFLLLILTNIFSSSLASQLESESLSSVEQDGRFILLRLSRDIQSADSISLPLATGDTNSSLQIIISGETYTYSLSNGNIVLSNNYGANQLNNFNTTISDLNFSRIGNINGKNTIKVNLTITSHAILNGQPESKLLESTIGTR